MPVYACDKLDSRSSLIFYLKQNFTRLIALKDISLVTDDACIVSIDTDNAVYSRI